MGEDPDRSSDSEQSADTHRAPASRSACKTATVRIGPGSRRQSRCRGAAQHAEQTAALGALAGGT